MGALMPSRRRKLSEAFALSVFDHEKFKSFSHYRLQEKVSFVVPASAGIFARESFRLKAGLRTSFS
jgi:hypothetical protein